MSINHHDLPMQNQNESEFIFIKQRLCILAKYLTSCMFFKYCRLLRASTCQTVIFLFVLRFSTKLRNMPRSQVLFITWKIQRIEQELFGIGVGRTLTTVFLPTYPFCFDLQHCSREELSAPFFCMPGLGTLEIAAFQSHAGNCHT